MSNQDLMKSITQGTTVQMKNIVDNWVDDPNFTRTGTSKSLALSFQKILEGFSNDDLKAILEGVRILDSLTKETYNLK